MPRHADEEGAVVSEIGRPPLLRIRHESGEILLERLEVEALELLRVVETLLEGIEERGVLVEELEIKLIGPPFRIGGGSGGHGGFEVAV
jgi:hypothetical protein